MGELAAAGLGVLGERDGDREADATGKPRTPAALLGEIAFLAMKSPEHKNLFLADLKWRVGPAIRLGQFRLWRAESQPVAFASWAFVTDELATRLASGLRRLTPSEWRCGDRRVVVDLMAPYGGREGFEREVTKMRKT